MPSSTSSKNKNFLDIIPIYSPRITLSNIKYNDQRTISDMTLNFDKLSISLLRQQFQNHNDELKLQQFISIAKQHLKFWKPELPNRQQAIVRYLTILFDEIDINRNGDMEWKQFTNYIIEKATVLKNLKSKSDDVKRYARSDLQPKIKIDGSIQKAEYIKDLNRMAFFEEGSSKIYFMDVNDGSILPKHLEVEPKKMIINISSTKKHKKAPVETKKKDLQINTEVRVLDILYIDDKKYQSLLVATSDGFVRGWKHNQNGFVLATQPDNEEQPFQHYFSSEIYSLSWDSVNEVLYCGQKNGNIYMWNLKTDLQKPLNDNNSSSSITSNHLSNNNNFSSPHSHKTQTPTPNKDSTQQKINHMITCMITMPKLQFMASGRMDGKLILWDTINHKKKWIYRQHTRGILSLAFNESMILLFSAGFDHKICVWNPYIETIIHKIEIHLAPILSLKVIENSNQLISMDSEGMVKITDTKRFHNIFSFNIEKSSTHNITPAPNSQSLNTCLSSFIAIDKPLKLIFVGKEITIYEYDKNYNPHATDEYLTVACRYLPQIWSFITASGTKVKIWSALNGDIEKIFTDVSSKQITSMTLDTLSRRFIVGDIEGNVSVHNVLNGAKMKHLTKHSSEILNLVAFKTNHQTKTQTQMLISCSIDNQIRIFKEVDDNYEIVRYIYFRKDVNITMIKYQSNIKLVMVGTDVGTIGFYDSQTGKNVGNCLNRQIDEITSLCETNESILLSTTATGRVNLFMIPPINNKFEKISSFNHNDPQKEGLIALGIATSCYNKADNLLYVVDDKMYLTCYDLKDIRKYTQKQTKSYKDDSICMKELGYSKTTTNAHTTVKFHKLWQIKTKHQMVKIIEFIPEENILYTSSFDKKVKLWNATNGEFIDSLQQNYHKRQPIPIAHYDTVNHILYDKNKKQIISNDVHIDTLKLNNDVEHVLEIVDKYQETIGDSCSNLDWGLKINLKKQKNGLIDDHDQPSEQVGIESERGQKQQNTNDDSSDSQGLHKSKHIDNTNKHISIHQMNKIKQTIAQLKAQYRKNGNIQTFYSNKTSSYLKEPEKSNTFHQPAKPLKRSMMKCIENCLDKKDSSKQNFNNKLRKNVSKDYQPIYKILGLKQNSRNSSKNLLQKKALGTFYHCESQLGNQEQKVSDLGAYNIAEAKKINEKLVKIDKGIQRTSSLLKDIKIKQGSKSMHTTFTKGLPMI